MRRRNNFPALINTPLQRGDIGRCDGKTVSTVFSGWRGKLLKQLPGSAAGNTRLKPGVNEMADLTEGNER